jgi:hypothetical protein
MKAEIINKQDINKAEKYINKFKYYNDLKFPEFTVIFDYKLPWAGVWYDKSKEHKYKIYVNPDRCEVEDDRSLAVESNRRAEGYTDNPSVTAVILHEFCHFIDSKYKIYEKYKKEFAKNDKVEINEIKEESCIDFFVLYIVNPYLLKLLSKERYEFYKRFFKSPISNEKKHFLITYSNWDDTVKKECKTKWKLSVEKGKIIQH